MNQAIHGNERLHQRTYEHGGVRTEIWLESVGDWRRTQYVMETGEHRTTQRREPLQADIRRHRREAT